MERASVPEAPIDEHGEASARKDNVGSDASCADRNGVILAKAQTEPVESRIAVGSSGPVSRLRLPRITADAAGEPRPGCHRYLRPQTWFGARHDTYSRLAVPGKVMWRPQLLTRCSHQWTGVWRGWVRSATGASVRLDIGKEGSPATFEGS